MISDVGYDNIGYITFEEFVPLMTNIIHEDMYLEDEIKELFIHFGNDKSLMKTEPLISKLLIASNDMLSVGKKTNLFVYNHVVNILLYCNR